MNATTFNAETSRRSGSTFHLRPEIRRAAVNAAGPKGVAVVNIIAEDARKTGISTATNSEIGAALGLSEKSASRLMTQLARGGVLTVREMRGAGPGRRRFVAIADVAEDGRRILPAAIFDDASVTVEVFGFNGARWLVPVTKLRRRDDLPDVETIAESRPKPSPERPRIGDKRDPYSAGIGDKIGVSSRARVRSPEESEKRATRPADAGSPAAATLRPPQTCLLYTSDAADE